MYYIASVNNFIYSSFEDYWSEEKTIEALVEKSIKDKVWYILMYIKWGIKKSICITNKNWLVDYLF